MILQDKFGMLKFQYPHNISLNHLPKIKIQYIIFMSFLKFLVQKFIQSKPKALAL
jgi:hypothetical protein